MEQRLVVHRGFVGSGNGNQSFQLWSHIANMPPIRSQGMPDQDGLVTIDTHFPTNPRCEAWIICSVKNSPYQGCGTLENRSGNDKSPNSLKDELAGILGALPSREQLCELVKNGTIDFNRIDMPSFLAFKKALLALL